MHRALVVRPALALLLAGVGAASPVPAQAPAPPATTMLPATGVEVVRLEVVVSEKGRRPRLGLRREDFVVLEDGEPQPIVQFQAFARSEGAVPAVASTPSPAKAEAEKADELRVTVTDRKANATATGAVPFTVE